MLASVAAPRPRFCAYSVYISSVCCSLFRKNREIFLVYNFFLQSAALPVTSEPLNKSTHVETARLSWPEWLG